MSLEDALKAFKGKATEQSKEFQKSAELAAEQLAKIEPEEPPKVKAKKLKKLYKVNETPADSGFTIKEASVPSTPDNPADWVGKLDQAISILSGALKSKAAEAESEVKLHIDEPETDEDEEDDPEDYPEEDEDEDNDGDSSEQPTSSGWVDQDGKPYGVCLSCFPSSQVIGLCLPGLLLVKWPHNGNWLLSLVANGGHHSYFDLPIGKYPFNASTEAATDKAYSDGHFRTNLLYGYRIYRSGLAAGYTPKSPTTESPKDFLKWLVDRMVKMHKGA